MINIFETQAVDGIWSGDLRNWPRKDVTRPAGLRRLDPRPRHHLSLGPSGHLHPLGGLALPIQIQVNAAEESGYLQGPIFWPNLIQRTFLLERRQEQVQKGGHFKMAKCHRVLSPSVPELAGRQQQKKRQIVLEKRLSHCFSCQRVPKQDHDRHVTKESRESWLRMSMVPTACPPMS